MDEKSAKTLVAIDGGGTKTEFVAFLPSGEIAGRILLPGSNPNSCGMKTSLSVLKQGLDELTDGTGEPCAIYAGIAGCGAVNNKKEILSSLKKAYPKAKVAVETDVMNVINCAPMSDRMIALICGTGSAIYAKTPESVHRVGGWGYLFDQGGSGYDFGRDAICASLAERDGIGKKTLITELVEQKLGADAWSKISELYSLGRDYIASFASIVFDCYRKGDDVARDIVEKNTGRLAVLLNGAADRYDCGNKVMASGGLLAHRDILLPRLTEKTGGHFDFDFNTMPQIYGAACGALSLTGERVNTAFIENFTKGLKKC